jgi:PAS domain S-box-containing protein
MGGDEFAILAIDATQGYHGIDHATAEKKIPRWTKTARSMTLLALLACGTGFCQNASGQVQKSQGISSVQTPTSNTVINSLTGKERAWLREHPVIHVVQDPNWPPVEFADERGEPSGMAGDYLNIIEQRLGVKFKRVRNLSWQEAYARLKRWEIDMTTSVAMTPERMEFWAFTKPYMKIPVVIVAHADVTYIADMRELVGKKVAVVEGYAVNDWIPRDFPEIQLVRVKTVQEGLKALQREEVFAYIENMLVVGYYMAKLKMTNLKIAGETPYINAQCMAVRKDWPILAGILDKAFDSIAEIERNDIYKKWLPIRYEHGFNYSLFWRALAIFAVIILGLIVWIRKLSREIRHRKKAEAALIESEKKHRLLFDSAGDAIFIHDTEARMLAVNQLACKQLGYTHEELMSMTVDQVDSPEEAPHASDRIARLMEHGHLTFETAHQRKDGSPIPTDVSAQRITWDGQPAMMSICRDITFRKQAEEDLKATAEKLRKSLVGTIHALSVTVETRDPYTAGHQKKVSSLARTIAQEMGLPKDTVEHIRMAGTIHDLGKISVPAEILSKPTKLTDIEFSLIKVHPQSGYDILKDVDLPYPVAEIVYQHHERLDGSGYPNGLKGDSILLESKILTVADVVEAMASHRPYRAARGIDAALDEIEANKGIFYDAKAVDACVRVFREKGFTFETTAS